MIHPYDSHVHKDVVEWIIEKAVRGQCYVDHGDDEATIEGWLSSAFITLRNTPYVIVYELRNEIVGVCAMHENEITLNYVLPSCVGEGVSRAMMDHVETHALYQKFSTTKLYSTAAARHFYFNRGYVELGQPMQGRGRSWNHRMIKVMERPVRCELHRDTPADRCPCRDYDLP